MSARPLNGFCRVIAACAAVEAVTTPMPWLHSDASTVPGSTELVVMTAISGPLAHQPMYVNFLLSLQRWGFHCVLALPVDSLKPKEPEARFWLRRTLAMMRALQMLPQRAIIVTTDSTDVLWTAGPDLLLSRFMTMGRTACFAAEMLCDTPWCRNETVQGFMDSLAPLGADAKYLNAGSAIGEAGVLASLFARMHR